MSAFRKDYEIKLKESINYFNSLSAEKQAFTVSHLLELDENDDEKLSGLFFAISNDISNYDETTISNKLFDLGLDKTYAVLFVQNIVEQAPTMQYQLQELSKFTDDDFETKFPIIVNEIWVERKNPQSLSKEQNITSQQLLIILNVTRTFMNNLARAVISEKKIIQICQEAKFSKSKIDVLVNTLKINSEFWKNMLIFSNTQDSFFSLQDVEQQNELILRTLQEILNLLKGKDSSTNNHFQ